MPEDVNEVDLKNKAAKTSIYEASAASVMDGFGIRYLTPYAVALGMSNAFIGVLSSLPQLFGSLAQIPGSKALEKFPRKRITISAAIMQALMWIPLAIVGILNLFYNIPLVLTSVLVILFYSLMVISGSFATPSWSSWMRDIIVKNTDSYFAKRNLTAGTVGLISTFIAGNILGFFKDYNYLLGFFVIFSIALIGRGVSAYFFSRQYEPKHSVPPKDYYFSFIQFVTKIENYNFGRFSMFISVVNFSVAIASPFFAVYMLKDLGFSYGAYTGVITISLVAMLASMPLWGKFGDKYGHIVMLRLCGALIFLVPFLWMLIPYFQLSPGFKIIIYLLFVETLSGIIWSGFNLASGNFVYYAVTPQRMGLCVAYNAVLASIGAFLGATIGGLVTTYNTEVFGFHPIIFVFGLSAVLRLISVIIFLPRIKEVRQVEHFGLEEEIKKDLKKIKHFIPDMSKNLIHGFSGIVKRTGW